MQNLQIQTPLHLKLPRCRETCPCSSFLKRYSSLESLLRAPQFPIECNINCYSWPISMSMDMVQPILKNCLPSWPLPTTGKATIASFFIPMGPDFAQWGIRAFVLQKCLACETVSQMTWGYHRHLMALREIWHQHFFSKQLTFNCVTFIIFGLFFALLSLFSVMHCLVWTVFYCFYAYYYIHFIVWHVLSFTL